MLDVYGDPEVFGKEIGGDIMCNKKTYMLINAFNRANAEQKKELQKWCSGEKFDRKEKVAAVTRLYDEIGIRQLCEAKIEHYFAEGKKWLDQVALPEERKVELRAYTNQMMKREN